MLESGPSKAESRWPMVRESKGPRYLARGSPGVDAYGSRKALVKKVAESLVVRASKGYLRRGHAGVSDIEVALCPPPSTLGRASRNEIQSLTTNGFAYFPRSSEAAATVNA